MESHLQIPLALTQTIIQKQLQKLHENDTF